MFCSWILKVGEERRPNSHGSTDCYAYAMSKPLIYEYVDRIAHVADIQHIVAKNTIFTLHKKIFSTSNSLPTLSPSPPILLCLSLLLLSPPISLSFHPSTHQSFNLSHLMYSYLRLCKEWLHLRPAATDTAPPFVMLFLSRLHYIIQ